MATGIPAIIEHIESEFGKIEHGWASTQDSDNKLQIVECQNGRMPHCAVLCTLGLSNVQLDSAVSGKKIRQELFVMSKVGQLDGKITAALDQISQERIDSKSAILRGDVIHKEGFLSSEGSFAAFYATLPIYFSQELWTIHDNHWGDIVFCWLLPIRKAELGFIKANGWRAFEERLDRAKFDLFDFNRPDLV